MATEELNPYQSSIEPTVLAEIVDNPAMSEAKRWIMALLCVAASFGFSCAVSMLVRGWTY